MAMLPLLDREFVERRGWLTKDDMLDCVAVMQSLPGLIIINMAVLIGYRVKGVLGALVAAASSVLTPFLVIAVIARWASSILSSPALSHVFLGVRAGTAALILLSLVKIARQTLDGAFAKVVAAVGFLAAVVLMVDVLYVLAFGFAIGLGLILRHVVKEGWQ